MFDVFLIIARVQNRGEKLKRSLKRAKKQINVLHRFDAFFCVIIFYLKKKTKKMQIMYLSIFIYL